MNLQSGLFILKNVVWKCQICGSSFSKEDLRQLIYGAPLTSFDCAPICEVCSHGDCSLDALYVSNGSPQVLWGSLLDGRGMACSSCYQLQRLVPQIALTARRDARDPNIQTTFGPGPGPLFLSRGYHGISIGRTLS